jgi:hypothetical protein
LSLIVIIFITVDWYIDSTVLEMRASPNFFFGPVKN